MQIVIVSPPGRKRESLVSMLESIRLEKSIITVDTNSEVLNVIDPQNPVTILFDYRYPDVQMDKDVSALIMNKAVDHVVLLQTRNASNSHFTHFTTSEVVFDDLSVEMLENLLKNIELNPHSSPFKANKIRNYRSALNPWFQKHLRVKP
jgi:hypothetical protein